jgi:HSP20 family molecular chaperone IbpA
VQCAFQRTLRKIPRLGTRNEDCREKKAKNRPEGGALEKNMNSGKTLTRTTIFFLAGPMMRESDQWLPSADIYRARNGWVIKMDIAGVEATDISISVAGRKVKISGCRHDTAISEGWSQYSMEIAYCAFERWIELPCNLESAEIHAEIPRRCDCSRAIWSRCWDRNAFCPNARANRCRRALRPALPGRKPAATSSTSKR